MQCPSCYATGSNPVGPAPKQVLKVDSDRGENEGEGLSELACPNLGMSREHSLGSAVVALLLASSLVIVSVPLEPSAHAQTAVATVNVGGVPEGVAYDSLKGEIFVVNLDSNTVSVISDATNAVVATVSVGSDPSGVAYDSGKGEVFVANGMNNSVSVISDTNNAVVATVDVESVPRVSPTTPARARSSWPITSTMAPSP